MKLVLPPRPRRADEDARMLPLVNLVFLLLVFFMLAGALAAPAAFRVQPPRSSEAGSAEAAAQALLVSADGRLAFGAEPFARGALGRVAGDWRQAHPGTALAIRADASVEAAELVRLLAELRAAGIERVVLMTDRADGSNAAP